MESPPLPPPPPLLPCPVDLSSRKVLPTINLFQLNLEINWDTVRGSIDFYLRIPRRQPRGPAGDLDPDFGSRPPSNLSFS